MDADGDWRLHSADLDRKARRGNRVRRREFIAVLGGAVVWPIVATGQHNTRMRRISIMMLNSEVDPEGQARLASLRQGLSSLGWNEGHNLQIEYRWEASEGGRAEATAAEVVASAPDVVVVNGSAGLAALRRKSQQIPTVFVVVTDPVGSGFVESLSRPGGTITGFSTFEPEIGTKWLEFLKELSPAIQRVACISDPSFAGFAGIWRGIEAAGPKLGLVPRQIVLQDYADDIETPLAAFAANPGGGLIILPTAINNASRDRIVALAARYQLPAIYPFRLYAAAGGLVSYGFETTDLFKRSATYVDRILKGENPGELPVQAPLKFELVVNLRTAKALRVPVPPTLLARADEIIE